MKTRNLSSIVCAMALLVAPFVQAKNYYWDSNGNTAGLGNTAGIWGTSAFVAEIPGGILNGTLATANTATGTADSLFFGTVNLEHFN